MRVGVPEAEVFAAADRVLARGERPTVERVRLELGRGSPQRIGQLLETWWEALAKRLAGETRLPDLPKDAAEAFRALWAAAVTHASTATDAAIAGERTALTQEREQLAQERERWEREVDAALGARQRAEHASEALQVRLGDLQQLVDQQRHHLEELRHRHAQAVADRESLAGKLESAHLALLQARTESAAALSTLETAHRATEDRWLAEVDRARQEGAKHLARAQQVEKLGDQAARKAADQIGALTAQLRRAEHDLTAKSARLAAVEGERDRMHSQLTAKLARLSPAARPAKAKAPARPKRAT